MTGTRAIPPHVTARTPFVAVLAFSAVYLAIAPLLASSIAPRSLVSLLGAEADGTVVVWGTVRNTKVTNNQSVSELDYSRGGVLFGTTGHREHDGLPQAVVVRENVGLMKPKGELAVGDEVVLFLRPSSSVGRAGSRVWPNGFDLVAGGSGLFRVSTPRCAQAGDSACGRMVVNLAGNNELFRGDTIWMALLNPPDSRHPSIDVIRSHFLSKVEKMPFTAAERARIQSAAERPPDGGVPLELLRAVLLYLSPSQQVPLANR